MHLKFQGTLVPAQEQISKAQGLSWSPNGYKLAVCGPDRVIILYDDQGERKDRFSTKPADAKGPKNYLVRGLAWSPDSTRLAVAQSDNIVYVYRLGTEWGEKKAICAKYTVPASVTCIGWPNQRLVVGLADGSVRISSGSNHSQVLYTTNSYTVSLSHSADGAVVATGHTDGSIQRCVIEEGSGLPTGHTRLTNHSCAPTALAIGHSVVVAAGSDQRVTFYDLQRGDIVQSFDYSNVAEEKEFTCAKFNPSGDVCVVGSFNHFRIYAYNSQTQSWEESIKEIPNLYTVTQMEWKPDGSRLYVSGLCGSVEVFDACWKKLKYKDNFEFTYVSPQQVIVKRLGSGTRIQLRSSYSAEIIKVNVYRDQFLVAHTPETLMIADLATCKLSEIRWSGSGNEKFYFEYPNVCMAFNAGELALMEYGVNEILGSVRTEFMNPHLLSVRINERSTGDTEIKRIAYLVDVQTIRVMDLVTNATVANVSVEDTKIDWLELNPRASKLLYRDKRRQLHLYDLNTLKHSTLLNYCSYVQWVPDSDVVVAQSRNNLCVWYSIDAPDQQTIFQIKGDIVEIVRTSEHSTVMVDEGMNTVSYYLDNALIAFSSAVDDQDYNRAVEILDALELSSETEAMWQNLAQLANESGQYRVAERCYAALGDTSRARYLHTVNKMASKVAEKLGGNGYDHYMIRGRLCALDRDFKQAEDIYLQQSATDEAMQMYHELHLFDEAIRVAIQTNHPDVDDLKRRFFQHLLQTHQEEGAARLKEQEGDYLAAINLYLKANMPGKAASVVTSYVFNCQSDILQRISAALLKSGMYVRAGEFLERLDQFDKARDAYRKGNEYRKCLDLVRREFPEQVVQLEEEWGDYLMTQKQADQAIKRFLEAGKYIKAIEAAVASRQWVSAMQIAETLPAKDAKPYLRRIARHFQDTAQVNLAERLYVKAGAVEEAVSMYTKMGHYEEAHKVAREHLSSTEIASLYGKEAQKLEQQGNYKDAEKLYILMNECDLAITMYKKARRYDDMTRLVARYHPDLLSSTHLHLAKQLEAEGNLRAAEKHYINGKEWQSAVKMYRQKEKWEDALRIARQCGGAGAAKQVALAQATYVGGENGAMLLFKMGLTEEAIDFLCENQMYERALDLAQSSMRSKVADVHYKVARQCEYDGKFAEAEERYLLANKPREPIDMYLHEHDFVNALRVADNHEPSALNDVYLAQAEFVAEQGKLDQAEKLYIRAQKAVLAVDMYVKACDFTQAMRVAQEYAPTKINDVHTAYDKYAMSGGSGKSSSNSPDDPISLAKIYEQRGDHSRAIDSYLKVTKNLNYDADQLEEAWENAARLAMNYVSGRTEEVVTTISQRMCEIGRFEQAADLWVGIERFQEAIDILIEGKLWDKAMRVADTAAPQFKPYVEKRHTNEMVENKQARKLIQGGNIDAGLSILIQQDRWEEVMEAVAGDDQAVVEKYSALYAQRMYQQGKKQEALRVLAKYGVPATDQQHFDLYKQLAADAFNDGDPRTMKELREMLYRLSSALKSSSLAGQKIEREFNRFLLVAHFINLRDTCQQHDLKEHVAMLSTSLLRYVDLLPADRAFYEAGLYNKEAGRLNMAFVFWNRFLDLADAMEDDQSAYLDNADFETTDIPFDFSLPDTLHVPKDVIEQVRDWVLAISMDTKVEQSLSTRECTSCGDETYDATLLCHSCKQQSQPCIVTGYPVDTSESVKCTVCGSVAIKSYWNKFLMTVNTCPWCGSVQNPSW